MPARSAIATLPPEVRTALDARLVEQGFADYSALTAWLSEQGYQISRSAVHRHGQHIERRLRQIEASTQAAQSLSAASADDEDALSDATLRLVQSRLFDLLVASDDDGGEGAIDIKELSTAARGVAEIARARQLVTRERRRIQQETREIVRTTPGLSPEMIAAIDARLMAA